MIITSNDKFSKAVFCRLNVLHTLESAGNRFLFGSIFDYLAVLIKHRDVFELEGPGISVFGPYRLKARRLRISVDQVIGILNPRVGRITGVKRDMQRIRTGAQGIAVIVPGLCSFVICSEFVFTITIGDRGRAIARLISFNLITCDEKAAGNFAFYPVVMDLLPLCVVLRQIVQRRFPVVRGGESDVLMRIHLICIQCDFQRIRRSPDPGLLDGLTDVTTIVDKARFRYLIIFYGHDNAVHSCVISRFQLRHLHDGVIGRFDFTHDIITAVEAFDRKG